MRLMSAAVVAGLPSVPVPREAVAAPVTTAVSQIVPALGGGSIERIYHYRGGYYPYRDTGVCISDTATIAMAVGIITEGIA